MKIDIGFSFQEKRSGQFKNTDYIVTHTVTGSYYDYFGDGSSRKSLEKLYKYDKILQIHTDDQYYMSHYVYKESEKDLIALLEKDQMLKPEFQKYILCIQ